MHTAFRFLCCVVLLSLSSCFHKSERDRTELPSFSHDETPAAGKRLSMRVLSFEGTPSLRHIPPESDRRLLGIGSEVRAGETVTTDPSSWVELAVGEAPDPASTSFSVIRVLPGTVFTPLRLDGGEHGDGASIVELGIDAGAVAVKAGKRGARDEFFAVTPHQAVMVRGTAFSVEANGERSRTAVLQGSVAVLPKGPLFSSLLDGRYANPVAGAVVRTAFAFAPIVKAGQELEIGGEVELGEEAYGALVVAAEKTQSNGFVLDDIDDPTPFIASAGSEAEKKLRAAFGPLRPAAVSSAARAAAALGSLCDPARGFEPLAISAPPERVPAPPVPPAVLWGKKVSALPMLDVLTRTGDRIVAIDKAGGVFVVDASGTLSWSAPLGAVAVTAVGETIAAATSSELVLLDGGTGMVKGRYSFGFVAASPFVKPVSVPDGLAVATPRGLALLRAEGAAIIKEIPIEGGVAAPPVLVERDLACVTGAGDLVFVDLASGSSSAPIPLGLGRALLAPRYRAGLVVAADRSGRLAAVSVSERRVAWTRSLDAGLGCEPEVGDGRLYAWGTDKTLRLLSAADGVDLLPPISGVASPPLLSGSALYWGTASGVLVVADAATGAVLKRLPIAESSSVRPIIVSGVLYAGTSGGKIVKVDLSR